MHSLPSLAALLLLVVTLPAQGSSSNSNGSSSSSGSCASSGSSGQGSAGTSGSSGSNSGSSSSSSHSGSHGGCCLETASFTSFGTGCAPAGFSVPVLAGHQQPLVGGNVMLGVHSPSSPDGFALMVYGWSSQFHPGLNVPLPFDMTALGFPGCSLYTSGESAAAVLLDSNGVGHFSTSIPLRIKLCGLPLAFQAFALAGTTTGLLATNGVEANLGS